MILPTDISRCIGTLFQNPSDRQDVEALLTSLWDTSLNVGKEQLARSILVLSNGRVSEIQKILDSGFMGDPRDVIVAAEHELGNPGHYFITPFTELEIFGLLSKNERLEK